MARVHLKTFSSSEVPVSGRLVVGGGEEIVVMDQHTLDDSFVPLIDGLAFS